MSGRILKNDIIRKIEYIKVHERTRVYLVLFALYRLMYGKVIGENFQNTTAERSSDKVGLCQGKS